MTKITVETDDAMLERLIFKALESWSDPTRVTDDDLQGLREVLKKIRTIDPVP